MLHDLFLVSEYFEAPNHGVPAQDLAVRFGPQAIVKALNAGYIEKCSPMPCAELQKVSDMSQTLYILTPAGRQAMQHR